MLNCAGSQMILREKSQFPAKSSAHMMTKPKKKRETASNQELVVRLTFLQALPQLRAVRLLSLKLYCKMSQNSFKVVSSFSQVRPCWSVFLLSGEFCSHLSPPSRSLSFTSRHLPSRLWTFLTALGSEIGRMTEITPNPDEMFGCWILLFIVPLRCLLWLSAGGVCSLHLGFSVCDKNLPPGITYGYHNNSSASMTVLERDNNTASLESVAFVQTRAIVWDTLDSTAQEPFFQMYKHVFSTKPLFYIFSKINQTSWLLNAA